MCDQLVGTGLLVQTLDSLYHSTLRDGSFAFCIMAMLTSFFYLVYPPFPAMSPRAPVGIRSIWYGLIIGQPPHAHIYSVPPLSFVSSSADVIFSLWANVSRVTDDDSVQQTKMPFLD